MPAWGFQQWGNEAWGGEDVTIFAGGTNNPLITARAPAPDSSEVSETAIVSVVFFDADTDLDTTTTLVEINGQVAYQGNTGFATGYAGTVKVIAGSQLVQLTRVEGWGYSASINVRAYIADLTGRFVDDSWSWATRANPACWMGTSPSAVETRMQSPFTTFLDIEPVRSVLMNNAVLPQEFAIPFSKNKAARVILQLAFSTEISSVLNQYRIRDTDALDVTVCERQKTIRVDQALQLVGKRIVPAIKSLQLQGILGEEYITSFVDYSDSTLYNYRVSLAATLVAMAAAIELQG
jgi:hypothetical protein